ncbi:sigma-70 family RNA polymerase sigma factor [Amycolatopsis sp. CA-161197]|uniref:sigma-70 family RNA polymerase sigma factor n=1 Tax=Amycolatopsis sp. CA-161197 TaxID=3239922 RepID=UPI003D94A4CF
MNSSSPHNGREPGVFSLHHSEDYAWDNGVFDTAVTTFRWLVTGPHPVCVDGASIPGLPARPVALDELGARLLAEECSQATRDAAWTYLITRARAEGGTWTMACVGLAMPVLLPVAAQLTNRFRGDKHDIHAAVVTGFLAALGEADLDRPAILVRLRWAAYRAGYAALREALEAAPPTDDVGVHATPPHRSSGHPDLVLVTAVRAGVITTDDAALISATRFGDLSLVEAARARRQSYRAAQQARHRAEQRLARYLTEPVADPADDASAPAPRASVRSHADGARHPVLRRSPTHRQRLRNVTRVSPELAEKVARPVSPHGPKSGVSARGTRLPARPHRGSATRQETRSCD